MPRAIARLPMPARGRGRGCGRLAPRGGYNTLAAIAAVAACASSLSAIAVAAGGVLDLDLLTFDPHVTNGSDWIVMFSAPWCPMSKRAAGPFAAAAAGNYSGPPRPLGQSFLVDVVRGPAADAAAARAAARVAAGDVRFARVQSEMTWDHWYNFPLSGARFGVMVPRTLR